MCTIACDDRERAIIPYLREIAGQTKINITVTVARQEVGDYAISVDQHLLAVLERKTWQDLSAGFRDGRKENVAKLLYVRQQTRCTLAYVIEGLPNARPNTIINGIPFKNLMAHLDHLAIRNQITTIYSRAETPEACAARIVEFAMNIGSLYTRDREWRSTYIRESRATHAIITLDQPVGNSHESQGNSHESQGNSDIVKEKVPDHRDPDLVARQTLWLRIPGVGPTLATQLAERCSVGDVYDQNVTAAELAAIKFPHGALIGEQRASKIVANVTRLSQQNKGAIELQTNVLAQIHGCSAQTAAFILTQISFRELIESTIAAEQLAQVARNSRGTTVGPALAANILRYCRQRTNHDEQNKQTEPQTQQSTQCGPYSAVDPETGLPIR